jgi:hypothetical protein
MQKIPTVFQRNFETDRLVRNEVTPGCEWVLSGEGTPTRKFDGTCCLIKDGKLYKRYDVKKGRTAPAGFIPAKEPDEVTGYWPGWVEVGDGPDDQYHRDAFQRYRGDVEMNFVDGTYELIGPKIQGNPEKVADHILVRHGAVKLLYVPYDFEGLREYLSQHNIEGIVWHHPDGRMAKLKKRDFGFTR